MGDLVSMKFLGITSESPHVVMRFPRGLLLANSFSSFTNPTPYRSCFSTLRLEFASKPPRGGRVFLGNKKFTSSKPLFLLCRRNIATRAKKPASANKKIVFGQKLQKKNSPFLIPPEGIVVFSDYPRRTLFVVLSGVCVLFCVNWLAFLASRYQWYLYEEEQVKEDEKYKKSSANLAFIILSVLCVAGIPWMFSKFPRYAVRELTILAADKGATNMGTKLRIQHYGFFGGKGGFTTIPVKDVVAQNKVDAFTKFRIRNNSVFYWMRDEGTIYHPHALKELLAGRPILFTE